MERAVLPECVRGELFVFFFALGPSRRESVASMTAAVHYQCQRCTACCRWPGHVRITEEEIPGIAAHLGLRVDDFIQRFTRLMPKRDGLALIDKPGSDDCFFLENSGCVLQDVKPSQCIGFPNTWSFPGWQESCKAIPTTPGNAEEFTTEITESTKVGRRKTKRKS